MTAPTHTRLTLAAVLAFAISLFLPGINWGLPSRAVDPFLFGDHNVWTGEEIDRLAPPESTTGGADVDANPIDRRDSAVVLNATESRRAEIVRRYRLFSYQPDEMITFKSLSRIRQFHGRPAAVSIWRTLDLPNRRNAQGRVDRGLVDLRSDKVFYLDHPEAFGRFYVVARFYTLMWGLVGVIAVFHLTQRVTRKLLPAAAASIAFACLPVVVNMVHEAKPHLPGAVLMLFAVIAALNYVSKGALAGGAVRGGLRGGVRDGHLGGSDFLDPSNDGDASRWHDTRAHLAMLTAGLAGVAVYAITNPFVLINALIHRDVLLSNLGNSTAMYATTSNGFENAIWLLAEGTSPVMFLAGVVGADRARRHVGQASRSDWHIDRSAGRNSACGARSACGVSVLRPLAAGKPAEYARFALFIDVVLSIAAVVAVDAYIRHRATQIAIFAVLLVVTGAARAHLCRGLPE